MAGIHTVVVDVRGIPEIEEAIQRLHAQIAILRYDPSGGLAGWHPDGEGWLRSPELPISVRMEPDWDSQGTRWTWVVTVDGDGMVERSEEPLSDPVEAMDDADAAFERAVVERWPGGHL